MSERKAGVGTENDGSGRGNRLIGVAMTGLGLFIVLISANIIPISDSRFSAPRWLAGCAGLAILLGGAAIALARPGSTPGSIVAFGVGTVLMDVLVLWLVARGMRQYVRGRRERAGDPAP
jgi:hypothetical protein